MLKALAEERFVDARDLERGLLLSRSCSETSGQLIFQGLGLDVGEGGRPSAGLSSARR
jgi:hypothetical protein